MSDRGCASSTRPPAAELGEPLATRGKPAVNIGADGRVWLARADGALLEVRADGGDLRAPAPLKGAQRSPR